jgi:hypothetical protein
LANTWVSIEINSKNGWTAYGMRGHREAMPGIHS